MNKIVFNVVLWFGGSLLVGYGTESVAVGLGALMLAIFVKGNER